MSMRGCYYTQICYNIATLEVKAAMLLKILIKKMLNN